MPAGTVAVRDVADVMDTLVHEVVPILTVAPDLKFVPVTVTDWLLSLVMLDGETAVTVAVGLAMVKALADVAVWLSGLVISVS